MERNELRRIAVEVTGAIWSTIDHESWSRQRLEIWRIFQENVEAAARTTPDLGRFVNSLSSTMRASPGSIEGPAQAIARAVIDETAPAVLRLIREEPATVVALLRVRQQEKRERWEEEQALEKAAELERQRTLDRTFGREPTEETSQ